MFFAVAAASRPALVVGEEVGSSGLGPPRMPTAATVAMSFVAAVALRPASVAEAEVGYCGLGPPRKPATAAVAVSLVVVFVVFAFAPAPVAGGSGGLGPCRASAAAIVVVSFVVVFVALRRAASSAQRAVADAAASSLFAFSSSVECCHSNTLLANPAFSDELYRDDSSSPAINSRNPEASTASAIGTFPAAAAAASPFRYSMRSNAAMCPPRTTTTHAKASRTAARVAETSPQRPG
jgi:hypothetical protein